jgi:hypothetical protein
MSAIGSVDELLARASSRTEVRPGDGRADIGGIRARLTQCELGVAADGGQRGPQLVAGISGETAQP